MFPKRTKPKKRSTNAAWRKDQEFTQSDEQALNRDVHHPSSPIPVGFVWGPFPANTKAATGQANLGLGCSFSSSKAAGLCVTACDYPISLGRSPLPIPVAAFRRASGCSSSVTSVQVPPKTCTIEMACYSRAEKLAGFVGLAFRCLSIIVGTSKANADRITWYENAPSVLGVKTSPMPATALPAYSKALRPGVWTHERVYLRQRRGRPTSTAALGKGQ